MSDLTAAHIEAERRIRTEVIARLTAAWHQLPAYNRENLPQWLAAALPIVAAGQRSSASLTNAYIARSIGRAPTPIDISQVTGAGVRNGTPPATVYERPFIRVWTALAAGKLYADAVNEGLQRAQSNAAMDVQLSMTHTVAAVASSDPTILGYKRVPDPGACDLCTIASEQLYHDDSLMPIHNNCGCGVEIITSKFPPAPSDVQTPPDAPQPVVHEHGELGPVLAVAGEHFDSL